MSQINFVIGRDDAEALTMASYPPPIGGGFHNMPEAQKALANIRVLEPLTGHERARGAYAIYAVTRMVKRLPL